MTDERPQEWPESFSAPALDCNHFYHWDAPDGLYRCIYCDDTKDEPKDGGQS